MTLVSRILPPILTTLIDGSIATGTAAALRNTWGLSSDIMYHISVSAMLRHLYVRPHAETDSLLCADPTAGTPSLYGYGLS